MVKNDIINYEFNKNIKLILNFRRKCSVFLNIKTDAWKNVNIIKKVIEGRPTVQYYIQVYRRDDIWQKDNERDIYKVYYITYLHTQLYRHHRNTREAIEKTLRRKEFVNMMIDWKQVSEHENDKAKYYRRRKGLLRK